MTVQNLYTQYLDGKVTKAKFLYEVRRDQNLDMISHHNNFDDTIKILKNKNIISEKASKESKQSTGKQDVEIIAKTIDMVNPYEYSRGMTYELETSEISITSADLSEDNVLKAQKKVLTNLTKNPQYYFDKLNGKGEVSDKWIETTKKNIDAIGKGKAAKLIREGIVDTENLKNVKLKNGKVYKNVKFHLPNDPKSFKTAEGGFMINQDIVNVVNANQEFKEGYENGGLVKEDQQNAIFEKYAKATGIPLENLKSMVRDAKESKLAKKDYDGDGEIESSEEEYKGSRDKAIKGVKEHGQYFDRVADVNADSTPISEDIDLGHQDNEPHMIKAELYLIAKQASELYKMIDSVDNMGEIDFPHWWQAKIVLAKNYLIGAKDYLDSALAVGNEDEEMEDDELDEDIFKKGNQQVVASTPQSKAALKSSGYQQIANTSDVTSISKG